MDVPQREISADQKGLVPSVLPWSDVWAKNQMLGRRKAVLLFVLETVRKSADPKDPKKVQQRAVFS